MNEPKQRLATLHNSQLITSEQHSERQRSVVAVSEVQLQWFQQMLAPTHDDVSGHLDAACCNRVNPLSVPEVREKNVTSSVSGLL